MTGVQTWYRVPFTGSRALTTHATWGQLLVERDMRRMKPGTPYNVTQVVPVPEGLRLANVFDTLTTVVGRYEALRTLFHRGDGGMTQQVLNRGHIKVGVWWGEKSGDEEAEVAEVFEAARRLDAEMEAADFDHARDTPTRAVVCLYRGAPAVLIVCLTHLAADLQSTRLVGDVLRELLTARAKGEPDPPAPPMTQPAEVAAFEATPRGRAMSDAALAHLRRQLTEAPMSNFPGAVGPPAEPSHWRGGLLSTATGPALRVLAERYRASGSTIALAATAAMIHALTGTPRCTMLLVLGNRNSAELRQSVGTLTQHTHTTFDLTGPSFGDLVRTTWAAAMRAFRHGRFDPVAGWAVLDEVTRDRAGEPEAARTFFNDMRGASAEAEVAGPGDVASLRAEAARSEFRWEERRNNGGSFFLELGELFNRPGVLRWTLLADTHLLPPALIRGLLVGIERLLVELVEADVALADVARVAGLPDRAALAPRSR